MVKRKITPSSSQLDVKLHYALCLPLKKSTTMKVDQLNQIRDFLSAMPHGIEFPGGASPILTKETN